MSATVLAVFNQITASVYRDFAKFKMGEVKSWEELKGWSHEIENLYSELDYA